MAIVHPHNGVRPEDVCPSHLLVVLEQEIVVPMKTVCKAVVFPKMLRLVQEIQIVLLETIVLEASVCRANPPVARVKQSVREAATYDVKQCVDVTVGEHKHNLVVLGKPVKRDSVSLVVAKMAIVPVAPALMATVPPSV